jgi:hypothetical protein
MLKIIRGILSWWEINHRAAVEIIYGQMKHHLRRLREPVRA